jgi:hypothetical protein
MYDKVLEYDTGDQDAAELSFVYKLSMTFSRVLTYPCRQRNAEKLEKQSGFGGSMS